MTTLPSWAEPDLASSVAEPFRSDREFWTGLAASADALITLVAAAGAGLVLMLIGTGAWFATPFVVPVAMMARAAVISRSSSRRNQAAFADRREWRDAERTAVAKVFGKVLLRHPRFR